MLNKRSFLKAAAAVATTAMAPRVSFADDDSAQAFIQTLGNRAIQTFSQKADKAQSKEKFRTLLSEGFDLPYIARLVVARHWNAASEAQRAEYVKLFERIIIDTYAGRFAEYAGETFKITGSVSAGGGDTNVGTQILRPSGPPIAVEWRVRKGGSGLKIIDVAVEGVSMVVTQRSEYAAVIEAAGGRFDGLLTVLRDKLPRAPG